MDLTAFGPYALNVRTNIFSYGPRARSINKKKLAVRKKLVSAELGLCLLQQLRLKTGCQKQQFHLSLYVVQLGQLFTVPFMIT